MWINIEEDKLKQIEAFLNDHNTSLGQELAKVREQFTDNSTLAQLYRDGVQGSDGELEADDDAVVSYSEGDAAGAYVMSWSFVYLRDTNAGLPDNCPKCDHDEFDCYGKCLGEGCDWQLDPNNPPPEVSEEERIRRLNLEADKDKYTAYNPEKDRWLSIDSVKAGEPETLWRQHRAASLYSKDVALTLEPPSGTVWTPARCIAKFQPQAWVNDNAVDIDGVTEFDITNQVLALGRETSLKIKDTSSEADELWFNSKDHKYVKHDGPFMVTAQEAVKAFWGVK